MNRRKSLAETGSQFDPAVVDAFLVVEAQWRQISRELADPADPATAPQTGSDV